MALVGPIKILYILRVIYKLPVAVAGVTFCQTEKDVVGLDISFFVKLLNFFLIFSLLLLVRNALEFVFKHKQNIARNVLFF